jgi:ankyrin repeat protein
MSATADVAAEVAALLHRLRLSLAARQPPASSLTAAAVQGDVDLVRAFLDAGSDVDERSIGFACPLQAAAGRGDLECVRLLLAAGADPDARVRGRSARGFAAGLHKKAIRELLEAAAARRVRT